MKIALVNVRYSPNLGDGVIADCLEHALRDRLVGVEIVNCDLAGREQFRARPGRLRTAALWTLSLLPDGLRNRTARSTLAAAARLYFIRAYRARLAGADLAIFGGGQLLADADCNFPVKIAAASAVARAARMKFAMYSLGVSSRWSKEGGALFREAFANADLVWASVRDKASGERWERLFAGAELPIPEVNIDPGVLTAEVYADAGEPGAARERKRIGLCVAAPTTINLHSDENARSAMNDASARGTLFAEIARLLIAAGHDVLVFTNGAADDEAFAMRVFNQARLAELGEDHIGIAPRSIEPADLVAVIRGCDGVIAHRLHANIIAYSLRTPHVGLGWDSKIEGFFGEIGREKFVAPAVGLTASHAVELMREALDAGIDETAHRAVIRRAHQDLDRFALAIGRALGANEDEIVRRAASATVAEIHPSASARRGPIAS